MAAFPTAAEVPMVVIRKDRHEVRSLSLKYAAEWNLAATRDPSQRSQRSSPRPRVALSVPAIVARRRESMRAARGPARSHPGHWQGEPDQSAETECQDEPGHDHRTDRENPRCLLTP